MVRRRVQQQRVTEIFAQVVGLACGRSSLERMRETTMMDALTIYGFVATMRHAGYFSFAVALLGLAEARYPGLRNAMRRITAVLANVCGAAMQRSSAPAQRRRALESRA